MESFGLNSFNRDVRLDSPSLREEIQIVRLARGAGRGKPIADDTWSEWRKLAKASKGMQSYSQREAAIVTWIAFYPFSGKAANQGLTFNKIAKADYPRLTDEWMKAVKDPLALRVLKYIQSVGLTPDQIVELVAEGEKQRGKKPRLSKRTLQRWAAMHRESMKADRPLSQKFVRRVLARTVLMPVKLD